MKQIIILRKDLNMSPGKAAAQACHASLMAYLRVSMIVTSSDSVTWLQTGQTKIIVMVEDEPALLALVEKLKGDAGTKNQYVLVRDAGHTELKGQNLTAIGIGPIDSDIIDPYTRKLLLYK